ncbi:MAG TPA: AAA family ATPase [Thermoanaerobaculia bacterium]|jgi:predicted ATPase|nr:AAA family ATPase [Thermoanaerobaculia bacterium]
MGIKELEVKEFRSLRHVRWTPGKLNVLIGQNGSGKSNLLRILGLLQKSAEGELAEEILREGGIAPLLWDEQEKGIDWIITATTGGGESYVYEVQLQRLGNTSSYRVSKETLTSAQAPLIKRSRGEFFFLDRQGALIDAENITPEDQTALPKVSFPNVTDPRLPSFHQFLRSWSVYHDLRVDREAPIRQASVSRSEKKLRPDGQNLVSVLHTLYTSDREFESSLDAAMSAAFGSDYEKLVFQPDASDQRIQLGLRWRSLKSVQTAASLSDGTLRFLRLIAILANPEPGEVIAIDEPETGLHPGMLPLVAELAAEAAERTQVIFTTHSPQFLDAFKESPPTTTVVELVDGETRLSVLNGDELAKWLQEYSLGTLFRSGQLEAMT